MPNLPEGLRAAGDPARKSEVEGFDVCVVGGGAAGMAALWELRDLNVVLIEATDRLGGRMRSEDRGPYWINLGCHLLPPPESVLGRMMKSLSVPPLPVPGVTSAVAFDGRVYDCKSVESYVYRLPLSIGERIAMVLTGLRLRRAVRGFHKVARLNKGESMLSMLSRTRPYFGHLSAREYFGKLPKRVDELFAAASRRSSSEMEEHAVGVEASMYAAVWGGKKGFSINNAMGGSGQLPAALATEMASHVRLNCPVESVVDGKDGVRISYDEGGTLRAIRAKHVIVATPAPIARKIVDRLTSQASEFLDSVKYGTFVVMGFLTNEKHSMPWDHIYGMTTPGLSFNMLFNHANPLRTGERAPGGSMMVYAGGDDARKLIDRSDDEVVRTFSRDLGRIYPQLPSLITETVVRRWHIGNASRPPRAPENGWGISDSVATDFGHVRLAGDYFAEIGNCERAATLGMEAAQRIRKQLASVLNDDV
ncbi:putative Amine oxidase [Mesorhizobium sp. SOD10]|nr:putative Amine oxidase [Mesorhizobium sp. SOD10]